MYFSQCRICWLSFQKHCIACEYKEVLYTLLGLIINLSAITSLAIQVGYLMCDVKVASLRNRQSYMGVNEIN